MFKVISATLLVFVSVSALCLLVDSLHGEPMTPEGIAHRMRDAAYYSLGWFTCDMARFLREKRALTRHRIDMAAFDRLRRDQDAAFDRLAAKIAEMEKINSGRRA